MNRLTMLENMVAQGPKDAFPLYGLALEYRSQQRKDDATRCFERLVAEFPDYLPTYLMAGRHHLDASEWQEAADVLKLGIELAKKVSDDQALGELEDALGEAEDALA